jgi:Sigma-70 region 2
VEWWSGGVVEWSGWLLAPDSYRNPLTINGKVLIMFEHTAEQVREKVDSVYRSESRRIFATLIRLLGDFELAEDALHDAFSAALEQWPKEGVPANPRAWLVSAGRFKAIDAMRRRTRFDTSQAALAGPLDSSRTPILCGSPMHIRILV